MWPTAAPTGARDWDLAIVKHILRRHGTELGVESELGKGSLFYFDLPAVDESPAEEHDLAALTRRPTSVDPS